MITEQNRSVNERGQRGTKSLGPIAKEIRFRCPHCQKLFCTTEDVFDGEQPDFDCAACDKSFSLTTELDGFGLYVARMPEKMRFCTCPKCSNMKPQGSDECPSCGVFESKYIQLQKAESPVLFELNQLWQIVVANFDEDHYHQDFLNRCHQKMALNFAYQKYAELQKGLGHDSLCAKYIKQIEVRLDQQLKSPKFNKDVVGDGSFQSSFTFAQFMFLGIGTIGMLLLIYNKFVPTFPNLNGLVLSLTIIAYGIGLFSNTKNPTKISN
jgi:hypothetical protein